MQSDFSSTNRNDPLFETSWARIRRFHRTPIWAMLSAEQIVILFYLLLSANDFETPIYVEGKMRLLHPGQMIVSQDNVVLNTKATRAKVRTAFKKFIALEILAIEITSDNHTIITVLEPYFIPAKANSTKKKPTNNQYSTNNQPDKRNLNKEEIKEEKEKKLLFSICDLELANQLKIYVQRNKPNIILKHSTEQWAADIYRMRNVDRRDPETIRRVIKWSQSDDFWWKHIVSPNSLRKHFDKLEIGMEAIGGDGK